MVRIICGILVVVIGAALVFGVVFTGYKTAHYMISAGWTFGDSLQQGWSELIELVGIKTAKSESGIVEFPMCNQHIDF